MRRIGLIVAMCGLLGWGTASALGGCGGDDNATIGASPDAASDRTTPIGTTTTTPTGNPPPVPPLPPVDAGNTDPLVSNPRKYTCGAVECDAGGGANPNVCCVPTSSEAACVRSNGCDNTGADASLQLDCDEALDCPKLNDNQLECCVRGLGDGGNAATGEHTTACLPSCVKTTGSGPKFNLPQLCKTQEECGDAGACTEKKCGNFKLHVCGTPPGCQ